MQSINLQAAALPQKNALQILIQIEFFPVSASNLRNSGTDTVTVGMYSGSNLQTP